MAFVEANSLGEAVAQGAFYRHQCVGKELLAARQQDGEKLKGRRRLVERKDDFGGRHQTAQVEFDIGVFKAVSRVGRPASRRIAIHDEASVAGVAANAADAAAKVLGIVHGVDVFAHGHGLDATGRVEFYGTDWVLPLLPSGAGVKRDPLAKGETAQRYNEA